MGLFLPGHERSRVVFDRELAEKFGVNAAIILSRIIWSLEDKITSNKTDFFKDGRWWMYDTRQDLAKYSGLTDKQIKSVLQTLRELKIIDTGQFDRKFAMRRNWFTIDTAVLQSSIGTKSTDSPIGTKGTNTLVQKGPIEEDKRDQYIGTKGTNSTLLPKSPPERLTESPTKNLSNVTPLPVSPRPKKPKAFKHTADDLDISKSWLEFALREMPWRQPPKAWTREEFAEGLFKLRNSVEFEGKSLNHFGLRAILKFVETSEFWKKVAWSPSGLLKANAEGVRKIDHILRQMKPNSLRQEEKIKTWAPVSEQEINNPFG